MRTVLIAIFTTGCILLIAGLTLSNLFLPKIIDHQTQTALRSLGFDQAVLPPPTLQKGTALYKAVKLDRAGFSEIGLLRIEYGWLHTLLKRRPLALTMKNMSLSGELEADNRVTLSGWTPTRATAILGDFPATRLVIENAKLSLLSEHIGGISIHYSLQARVQRKTVHIQGHILSSQKQLSYEARLDGQINKDGRWQSTLEILRGKLALPHIKAGRVNGTVTFSGHGLGTPEIVSELRAGGLTLAGTPWQNASATLEGTPENFNIYAGAKSAGIDGLEIALNIGRHAGENSVSGAVYAKKLKNLFDYLHSRDSLPFPRATLVPFDMLDDITTEFIFKKDRILFQTTDEQRNIDIKGDIKDYSTDSFSIRFISTPISLERITPQKYPLGGSVRLFGEVKKDKDTFTGHITSKLDAVSIKPGGLHLSDIDGLLTIDRISTLSSSSSKTLPCRVPLARSVSQSCTLDLSVESGRVKLQKATIRLMGGQLSAQESEGKTTLKTIYPLHLSAILNALSIAPFSKGRGYINIKATLENREGKTFIRDARITNKNRGIIQIDHPGILNFLQGSALEKQNIKQALTNYHYESFDIRLSGPLDGVMSLHIKARGQNPTLSVASPILLDIKTRTRLMPLFAPLVIQEE